MKKLSILFITSLLGLITLNAQKSAGDYVKGEVILLSGETINCFINYEPISPGIIQSGFKYLENEKYQILKNGGKIKGKEILKLKPKEVEKVILDNGKTFKKVTYADLTAVGPASIPKSYLYEVLVEGKITLFRKFEEPGGPIQVVEGEEAQAILDGVELTMEEKIANANSKFELLVFKDEKMAKNITNIKIQDYISDNEEVLQKFENEEYGSLKTVLSSKIKPSDFNYRHPLYLESLTRLITDYNK